MERNKVYEGIKAALKKRPATGPNAERGSGLNVGEALLVIEALLGAGDTAFSVGRGPLGRGSGGSLLNVFGGIGVVGFQVFSELGVPFRTKGALFESRPASLDLITEAIDEERRYQDSRWTELDKLNRPADFVHYIKRYVKLATAANHPAEPYESLDNLRKVVALCVAALELWGTEQELGVQG
jgi:hypothetical protein